jgi:hypothetical protein
MKVQRRMQAVFSIFCDFDPDLRTGRGHDKFLSGPDIGSGRWRPVGSAG